MAVNKISLNSVEAQNVSQITILPTAPVNNITDQFDIFYHLGTDLNTTSFTNPMLGGNINITIASGDPLQSGTLDRLVARSQALPIRLTPPGNSIIQFELLNNYEIDLQSYIVANASATAEAPLSWLLEASNDGTTWIKLDQVINHPNTANDEAIYFCESRLGFFKYFRFRNFIWNGEVLGEILFFGRLRNLITGQAAIENTKDILASYPNVDAISRYENQIIRYDGTYWEPRTRFPYEVIKLDLTTDHTITNAYKPTFYIVSPNGSNRVITLPTSPVKDDVIKIKNVDGNFDLTIQEIVADPNPIVMNNTSKLQYEFVWDGIEWLVTG